MLTSCLFSLPTLAVTYHKQEYVWFVTKEFAFGLLILKFPKLPKRAELTEYRKNAKQKKTNPLISAYFLRLSIIV